MTLKSKLSVHKMARCALFAALLTVCAWLCIPLGSVTFTLQSLGLLLCLGVMGGKWGCISIGLYLALGAVGLPVFSGFRGGAAALLGPTGGFLWGFGLGALAYWAAEKLGRLPAMVLCQLVCYGCGLGWFLIYAPGTSLWGAALITIVPYLIPDICKLLLAHRLSIRFARYHV